jgi:putative oxidoreductase
VLAVAAVAIGLAFNGPGPWSVDAAIGLDLSGVAWGLAALGGAVAGAAGVLVLFRERTPALAKPSAA